VASVASRSKKMALSASIIFTTGIQKTALQSRLHFWIKNLLRRQRAPYRRAPLPVMYARSNVRAFPVDELLVSFA
jgi:hypothetical protein